MPCEHEIWSGHATHETFGQSVGPYGVGASSPRHHHHSLGHAGGIYEGGPSDLYPQLRNGYGGQHPSGMHSPYEMGHQRGIYGGGIRQHYGIEGGSPRMAFASPNIIFAGGYRGSPRGRYNNTYL